MVHLILSQVAGTHRPVELDIVCEESQGKVIHSTKCSREPCQWVSTEYYYKGVLLSDWLQEVESGD